MFHRFFKNWQSKKAITVWSKMVPLKITWINMYADINIIFSKDVTFKNVKSTVISPVYSKIFLKNNLYFIYIDERATQSNVILQRTINHVFGHLFGLHHEDMQSLMSPILDINNPTFSSNPWMFAAKCQTSIMSAFSHMQDGLTYFFKEDKFWRISKNYQIDSNYPKYLNKKWHGVPTHFDEGFVWGGNWFTYFFKGKNYYRYNNTADRIEDGYPLLIREGWRNLPDNIDAIFTDQERNTYFFKDDLVYLYDNARDIVAFGYPKKITDVYPNVPSNLDTVFRYYFDGEVYFFKDLYFWRWNIKLQRADGPFPINKGWKNLCLL